jgi:hypothetical protein
MFRRGWLVRSMVLGCVFVWTVTVWLARMVVRLWWWCWWRVWSWRQRRAMTERVCRRCGRSDKAQDGRFVLDDGPEVDAAVDAELRRRLADNAARDAASTARRMFVGGAS